ncbi:MAG: coproporphyrinogen-III oxidase family protein [Anaerolineae bacterium]
MAAEIALYLHIPFCKVRCSYCAFNVIVGRDILMPDFVTALRREMRLVRAAAPDPLEAQTLYFGGGTPSLLSPEQINALIETARTDYALVPGAEITLEANPDDLTWEKLKGYRSAGVNRISIGVQSTAAHDLDLFRRTHDALAAERAVKLAKEAGIDSTSVDLIYGVPGQTLHTWASTLDEVLGWRPDHLSL